jgi:hypothetical protein
MSLDHGKNMEKHQKMDRNSTRTNPIPGVPAIQAEAKLLWALNKKTP